VFAVEMDIRASDADRKRVVAELQEHFVAGRLDDTELGDRVGRALAARTLGDLTALLADLPRPAQASQPAPPRRSEHNDRGAWPGRGVTPPVLGYLAVMVLLVVIWLLTSPGGYFWPMWPMLGWGIALMKQTSHRTARLLR
jgi:hypothetical protein